MLFLSLRRVVSFAEMARVNIACAIVVLLSSCHWCVRLLRALFQFNGNQFLLLFLFGISAVVVRLLLLGCCCCCGVQSEKLFRDLLVVALLLLLWGPIRKTNPGPPCCCCCCCCVIQLGFPTHLSDLMLFPS